MMDCEFKIGAWIGRRQAFGAIAGHATAAEISCLREIRETKAYLGRTSNWPAFCELYLGVSRAKVDRRIQYLEEFGERYFQICQLVPIAPEAYRAIACNISGEGLTYKGRTIPITVEHASEIAKAVDALRLPKRAAVRKPAAGPPPETYEALHNTLQDCIARIDGLPRFTGSQANELLTVLALLHSAVHRHP